MELYEDMSELLSDDLDPTPPITPTHDDDNISDETETVEASSSSEENWKQPPPSEDNLSVVTDDSLSFIRRESKSGKRVTFPEDELLVRVIFIPIDYGPRLEELVPCDPETLVGDTSDMSIEGFAPAAPSRLSPAQRPATSASCSRPADPPGLSTFGSLTKGFHNIGRLGTPAMKTLGRGLCIQGTPSPTAPKPAPRKRGQSGAFTSNRGGEQPSSEKEQGENDRVSKENVSKDSGTYQGNNRESIKNKRDTSEGNSKVTVPCENTTTKKIHGKHLQTSKRQLASGSGDVIDEKPEAHAQRQANRKIQSAVLTCKSGEHYQSGAGSLQSRLQARRLQRFTSQSTTSLQRVKSASMDDLKPGVLYKPKSASYDNVNIRNASGSTSYGGPLQNRLSIAAGPSAGTDHRRLRTATRTNRRSLLARSDASGGVTTDETVTMLPPPSPSPASPLPRIHPSPYRQSSLPSINHRSATFIEAGGGRERGDSARSDSSGIGIGHLGGQIHAMKHGHTPLATRKLYAWHVANGTLGKTPSLEAPCISPLWESLPMAAEPPVPTTST